MPAAPRQFWIGVVSREHVLLGVEDGSIQLNHGKKAPLQRMRVNACLPMHSPRDSYPDGQGLQRFTAIGVVSTGEPDQVEMTPEFRPYRVDVAFLQADEAPVKPLVEELSFIENKTHRSAAFRFGHIKVSASDCGLIAKAMGVESQIATDGLQASSKLPLSPHHVEHRKSDCTNS